MKKIFNQPIFAALAAIILLAAGCTTDNEPAGNATEREISIQTSIQGTVTTRSPLTDGGDGAKFTLANMHFLRKDGASQQTNFSGVTALLASRDANGKITFASSTPNYNLNGQNSYFVAYWPQSIIEAGVKNEWDLEGHLDILLSTLDPAQPYDAGNYLTPKTEAMTLYHVQAQLRVTCKPAPGVSATVANDTWGKITDIVLLNSFGKATYTYATNAITYSSTVKPIPLYLPGYQQKFNTNPYTLRDNPADITAAGVFSPIASGELKFKIYSEKVPGGRTVTVQLKNGATNVPFERGKNYHITFTFGATDKEIGVGATNIEDWDTTTGGTFGEDIYNLPDPNVKDYYYEDGSWSPTLNGPGNPLGIVFWVSADKKNFKVMSMTESKGIAYYTGSSGTSASDRDDGMKNMETIMNANPSTWQASYPLLDYCSKKGSGWYVPAIYELEYMICAWNDHVPVTWYGYGGQAFEVNESARSAWNSLLEKGGGSAIAGAYYCSSTNYLAREMYNLQWNTLLFSQLYGDTDSAVRCIKSINH